MKTTKQRILDFIKEKEEVSPKMIVDFLEITEAAVYRHLKDLIEQKKIGKIGKTPRVFYFLIKQSEIEIPSNFSQEEKEYIEENFFLITPQGEILEGVKAFIYFCKEKKLEPNKTAGEYIKTLTKYSQYKKEDLINGMEKIKSSFEKIYLDEIYYLDFYSIERFGKTKLGWLLLYAKQTQNKKLMKKIFEIVKNKIEKLIKNKQIDAIGFIPPTIKRKIQLQKELEKSLNLTLPKINLVKASGEVAVPQKSLSKLRDRMENTRRTIFIDNKIKYKNILLIDDAVGSGATLNETAKKIKERNSVKGKIIGLALVGSFKGFDVISEV